jgi:hypothetical protein
MANVKARLSSGMAAFLYDHKKIPEKGKSLRNSYEEVAKTIQSIGIPDPSSKKHKR